MDYQLESGIVVKEVVLFSAGSSRYFVTPTMREEGIYFKVEHYDLKVL